MIKYYYTDPLAAAWMAKHFGMWFRYNETHDVHDVGEFFKFECTHLADYEPPYYIHPDSVNLLKPQDGDLCYAKDDSTAGAFPALMLGINSGKIIQRNGQAFHYPEVEE